METQQVASKKEQSIIVPAQIQEFEKIRLLIESFLESNQIIGKANTQLLIAADEIFTNIVNYAYGENKDSSCTIEMLISYAEANKTIELTFKDSGIPYNPLEHKLPDIEERIKEKKVGGLGILMVRKMMTSVDYMRQEDNNILLIKKLIS